MKRSNFELPDKDAYKFQRARIERIVSELVPNGSAEFHEGSTFIRFRVRDKTLGTRLVVSSGEWTPRELADKSDDWLCGFIVGLSGGKIKQF